MKTQTRFWILGSLASLVVVTGCKMESQTSRRMPAPPSSSPSSSPRRRPRPRHHRPRPRRRARPAAAPARRSPRSRASRGARDRPRRARSPSRNSSKAGRRAAALPARPARRKGRASPASNRAVAAHRRGPPAGVPAAHSPNRVAAPRPASKVALRLRVSRGPSHPASKVVLRPRVSRGRSHRASKVVLRPRVSRGRSPRASPHRVSQAVALLPRRRAGSHAAGSSSGGQPSGGSPVRGRRALRQPSVRWIGTLDRRWCARRIHAVGRGWRVRRIRASSRRWRLGWSHCDRRARDSRCGQSPGRGAPGLAWSAGDRCTGRRCAGFPGTERRRGCAWRRRFAVRSGLATDRARTRVAGNVAARRRLAHRRRRWGAGRRAATKRHIGRRRGGLPGRVGRRWARRRTDDHRGQARPDRPAF